MADENKAGARHSRRDNEIIQAAHDGLVELGAFCVPPMKEGDETKAHNLSEHVQRVQDAWYDFCRAQRALAGSEDLYFGEFPHAWTVLEDALIVRGKRGLYSYPYTLTDSQVIFGEPTEVEIAYMPKSLPQIGDADYYPPFAGASGDKQVDPAQFKDASEGTPTEEDTPQVEEITAKTVNVIVGNDNPESVQPDDILIAQGGEIKDLSDKGLIGGYLVIFSSDSDPDLSPKRDFFTKETNFGPHRQSIVFYAHGMDKRLSRKALGEEPGALMIDDIGVWIEEQLNLRDEYERAVYELAKAGKLGWSSGTAAHLVERVPVKEAHWLKMWPLGLDASITPIPAEPRTRVMPLKSLIIDSNFLRPDDGSPPLTPDGVNGALSEVAGAEPGGDDRATKVARLRTLAQLRMLTVR